MEKRKSPWKKLKIILEHFESNFFNVDKRSKATLNSTFQPKQMLDEILTFLENRKYICKTKDHQECFDMTLEGLDFLEKLRTREIEKKQANINKAVALVTVAIALSSVSPILTNLTTSSPVLKYVNYALLILIVLVILLATAHLIGRQSL